MIERNGDAGRRYPFGHLRVRDQMSNLPIRKANSSGAQWPGLQTGLQTYRLARVNLLQHGSGSQNPEPVVAQGFAACVDML